MEKNYTISAGTAVFGLLIMLGFCFTAGRAVAAETNRVYAVGDITVISMEDARGSMEDRLFPTVQGDGAKLKMLPAPSAVNVFLVKTGGKLVLIDAGWGKDGRVQGNMLACLEAEGISPDSIDIVLVTHMHGDHISGLLSDGKPVFAKAQVLVAQPELAAWVERKEGPEAGVALAVAVATAYGDRVKTFAFGDTVVEGIEARSAVGHTPGHTAYYLSSGGKAMLVAGDFLHASDMQAAYPEVSSVYDMNPELAASTRRTLLQELAAEAIPVAGMHIPDGGVRTVTVAGDGFTLHK